MSQSGIYQTALQVPELRIARLNTADLNELMRELLRAQAYRCGCPDTSVNAEINASDDGCDGWSAQPANEDRWLGKTDTCWQFKAGKAGEPAKLGDEVQKPIPRATLQRGGRFVLVASGSASGEKGTADRRNTLVEAACKEGIPAENIDVYGSERLAEWCNDNPAVAARWVGAPEGLQRFDDWARSAVHRISYQASPIVKSNLSATRIRLDFQPEREGDSVHHLHIRGQPGVGKTRFALELCRDAPWRDSVIYVRQAEDIRLSELLDSAAERPNVRLMVVADEVQQEWLEPLRDSIERADGGVRLITIGGCSSPDPRRIPELQIEPLDAAAMHAVVSGWYPAMPPEHVDFVTRFADGYVRLGRLTADAVNADPSATVPDLLDRDAIRTFLNRMLGGEDRRSLFVVAVLTHVGWADDKEQEGKAIASHLDLDWNDVKYQVEQFHLRMGIAPRGGRYRYISPNPLGIYLVHQAWEIYPDQMQSLPSALPSEAAKEAYCARLKDLASNPHAQQFARDQLRFFFRIDDFVELHAARRWSAFSAVDPDAAARNLRDALSGSRLEDRRRVTFQAVGEIVWRLARIASRTTGFHDATTALALLAEAENGSWGNGASREFVAKYQVYLAATSLPYLQRLGTLDELIEHRRPSLLSLAIQALARVADDSPGSILVPSSDHAPEPDWHPSSGGEHLQCIAAAVDRLQTIAAERDPAQQGTLLDAAQALSQLLRDPSAVTSVTKFFIGLCEAYPELREPLRKLVADVIRRDKERLSPEQRQTLEQLHARFEDPSLGGRLRQHVEPQPWERETKPDFAALAAELVAPPGVLAQHWRWLTSGQAAAAWQLGEALAAADVEGQLAEEMPRLRGSGRDLRVVCGYISARRDTLGEGWYERWVVAQFERDPQPVALLLEVVWRCGATDKLATEVAELLRGQRLSPPLVGQLTYSDWNGISADALQCLLRAMVDTGHGKTAISILQSRMEHADAEIGRWRPLALELATDLELIRCREMPNHYWQKVAEMIVEDHPRKIAGAILRAHAQRDESTSWFLKYERAAVDVLLLCIEHAPDGAWQELRAYLWPPYEGMKFGIGFPTDVLERLPRDDVLAWVAELPAEQAAQRAALLARLTHKHNLTDESLPARILATYGGYEIVDEAFFSHHVSGAAAGRLSTHWEDLKHELQYVAMHTKLPGLRRWADKSVAALDQMVSQQRQHEEEEALHVRRGA